jgi:hypothetical protein
MTLKKNRAGQLAIPAQKPQSDKAWRTIQMSRQFNNEVSKVADRLGLNVSKYIRKKLEDLLEAARFGKLPADAAVMTDITCSKCQSKIDN